MLILISVIYHPWFNFPKVSGCHHCGMDTELPQNGFQIRRLHVELRVCLARLEEHRFWLGF